VAEPGPQLAPLAWALAEAADPQADDLEPVLVHVRTTETLAEHFADAVDGVGAHGVIGADPHSHRIHPGRVVAAREHDPAHALPPRCLEDVVGRDEVRGEQPLEGILGGDSCEMDHRVRAVQSGERRVEVGEVGRKGLLAVVLRGATGRRPRGRLSYCEWFVFEGSGPQSNATGRPAAT
jgi:hypothetical protein